MKDGIRGGERKENWQKEQMERQTESGKKREGVARDESEKVGVKRSRGKQKEKKKPGTGRDVPNNICKGGRRRTCSSGCVREKAFQTTSVMRATSVMRGREESIHETSTDPSAMVQCGSYNMYITVAFEIQQFPLIRFRNKARAPRRYALGRPTRLSDSWWIEAVGWSEGDGVEEDREGTEVGVTTHESDRAPGRRQHHDNPAANQQISHAEGKQPMDRLIGEGKEDGDGRTLRSNPVPSSSVPGLSNIIGIIVYISANAGDPSKSDSKKNSYSYGWSFYFGALSFIMAEMVGVLAVHMFIDRHRELRVGARAADYLQGAAITRIPSYRYRYRRRSRSSSRSTDPSHSREASPVGLKAFGTLPSTELSMYTLPKGQTGTPTATYNSTERDHNFLQVHNCIQKDLKDSGGTANRRTTPV
ncbi:hypothetical protein FQN60_012470 [Etheostoma spectabile]|uniref:Voltage-dependent calcium channel gamma-2 subunit n=1 Tax=Etheostoma spectabile TaxID=54343 RepID=A0A5J5DPQ6_9PERO|nr:hypothetical protein FQN60_012470 [Etheostoma spectabile]